MKRVTIPNCVNSILVYGKYLPSIWPSGVRPRLRVKKVWLTQVIKLIILIHKVYNFPRLSQVISGLPRSRFRREERRTHGASEGTLTPVHWLNFGYLPLVSRHEKIRTGQFSWRCEVRRSRDTERGPQSCHHSYKVSEHNFYPVGVVDPGDLLGQISFTAET